MKENLTQVWSLLQASGGVESAQRSVIVLNVDDVSNVYQEYLNGIGIQGIGHLIEIALQSGCQCESDELGRIIIRKP